MDILIAGASGFIGRHLSETFRGRGWQTVPLTRADFSLPDDEFERKFEKARVIINAVGASISKRWSTRYKREIYDSRILTTGKIAAAINRMEVKPDVFISNSGVNIYKGEMACTEESSSYGDDFMGSVCVDWEKAAWQVKPPVRTVILRLGVVVGKKGGALQKMMLPFKMGLGARVGDGHQPFSWIHMDDLMSAYLFIIENQKLSGIVNVASPGIVTNKELTSALGKVLKRPVFLAIPPFILRMIYGEGAGLLIEGKNAYPGKLLGSGFGFRFPSIKEALEDIINPG
jgi:uncharacterized protein (TIGR01777 family)